MKKNNHTRSTHFSANLYRLKGALTSGKKAAYVALAIKLIKPFTRFIDFILPNNNTSNIKDIPKTIIIVSPPRAGSTIVFQTLVRVLPSTYISNLHALFPGSASKAIEKKNGSIPFKSKNYYGYTANLYDVYEANEFIDPLFLDRSNPGSVRDAFIKLTNRIKVIPYIPFVIKNTRNYKNTRLIAEAVPETIFIRIKRDIKQVIQSELRAYYDLKTFHPVPDSLINEPIENPVDFVIRQILTIETEIDKQLEEIDSSRIIEWQYEDFCKNPLDCITALAVDHLDMSVSQLRPHNLTFELKISDRVKVSPEDEKEISSKLKKNHNEEIV